jgi:hypothetical protein
MFLFHHPNDDEINVGAKRLAGGSRFAAAAFGGKKLNTACGGKARLHV